VQQLERASLRPERAKTPRGREAGTDLFAEEMSEKISVPRTEGGGTEIYMRCVILMNDVNCAEIAAAEQTNADAAAENTGLSCIHGLSVYIETAGRRILADTGQNGITWDNAAALGIDLAAVDTVILSHGHYDHTGGVMSFAAQHPGAGIFLNELAGGDYWNMREVPHYIGIDPAILSLPQTRLLRGDCLSLLGADGSVTEYTPAEFAKRGGIADGDVIVFGGVTGRRLWPQGNAILTKRTEEGFVQDSFDHEQYAVVRDAGRTVLLGGCAHNGMLNILDRYFELFGEYPNAVVSGFHMVKHGPYDESEIATIRETAEELRKLPILYFAGHCTSLPAYALMKPILGEQLRYFGTGEEILAR